MRHRVLCLLGGYCPNPLVEVEFTPLGADDLAFALHSDKLQLQRQPDRRRDPEFGVVEGAPEYGYLVRGASGATTTAPKILGAARAPLA